MIINIFQSQFSLAASWTCQSLRHFYLWLKFTYKVSSVVVSCCIQRWCYPTQNLDAAINIYFDNYHYIWLDILRIKIFISLNINIHVLYGICRHVNVFDLLLFFQFKPLMKVWIIPKDMVIWKTDFVLETLHILLYSSPVIIGSNKIEYKKVKKHNNIMKKGKCSPVFSK